MTRMQALAALGVRGHLPAAPDAAFLLGTAFVRLGGMFTVASDGRRYMGRPCHFPHGIPQLPETLPHQRLQNDDEYEGAIKLVEGLIRIMDPADRDLLFGIYGNVAVDERKFLPSIDEPRRAGL